MGQDAVSTEGHPTTRFGVNSLLSRNVCSHQSVPGGKSVPGGPVAAKKRG